MATFQSKFDKNDICFVIVNNHFAQALIVGVEYMENQFFYNLAAKDYHGFVCKERLPECLCASTLEELFEIHKQRMSEKNL